MSKLKQWLESETKDFDEGLKLLSRYSKNRSLIASLNRRENAQNRKKLEYELNKFEHLAEEEEETIIPNNSQTPPQDDKEPENPQKITVEINTGTPAPMAAVVSPLDELVAEMQRLYTSRCQLSNCLAELEDDKARAEVVAQVLAHQDAYNALAIKKAYFDEHGKFPEAPVELTAGVTAENTNDRAELIILLGNLRSQRSKAKKAVETDPENVEKQEKLAKISVEAQAVADKIKLLS